MPSGGGSKPKAPAPTPPAPTQMAPEVALAAANERERLKRAKGRAASHVVEPGLELKSEALRKTL